MIVRLKIDQSESIDLEFINEQVQFGNKYIYFKIPSNIANNIKYYVDIHFKDLSIIPNKSEKSRININDYLIQKKNIIQKQMYIDYESESESKSGIFILRRSKDKRDNKILYKYQIKL